MNFTVDKLFSDHVVLQMGKPVSIWGMASSGSKISVTIQGQHGVSTTAENGRWQVDLPPLHASCAEIMQISDEKDTLVVSDVAVGEVWVASGQSNMEFPLRAVPEYRALQDTNLPMIRLFGVPRMSYPGQLNDDDFSDYRIWRPCVSNQLRWYSAVPFYFAKELFYDKNIPIGILNASVGGSRAVAWADPQRLAQTSAKIWIDEYQEGIQDLDLKAYTAAYKNGAMFHAKVQDNDPFREKMWRGMHIGERFFFQRRIKKIPSPTPEIIGPLDCNRPGALYENMILPLAPFALRGVIWYQGEADDVHGELYSQAMRCVIESWRSAWNEALPFLMMQLAPYRGFAPFLPKDFPLVRSCQAALAGSMDRVFLTNIMDDGMPYDIHPKNKKLVGHRLALLAKGLVYKEPIVCQPPVAIEAAWIGNYLTIVLKNSGGRIYRHGIERNAWDVYADGVRCSRLRIQYKKDRLLLRHRYFQKAQVLTVQYGWHNYCHCTVCGSARIPLQPFRFTLRKDQHIKTF